MRPYLSILAMRFKTSIQYRSAAVAGYVTQMFFGIVMVSVLGAFYASGRNGTAVPLQSFVNYIWPLQAFWIGFFVLAGRLMLQRVRRKLVVQGG
jgi:ABC-2 type transport system permease protein